VTRAVDLRELRRSLGQLTRGELLIVAQRAAEMVPEGALPSLLGGLVELHAGLALAHGPAALLEEVQSFRAEGIGGKFYVSFDVNSRNCSEQSRGTDAFIAEFDCLVAKCMREAEAGPCQTVAQAFEVLFSLLRVIDKGNDDVLFFADEGGSWSVGVDWHKALPAYFLCLAQTASAAEYAHRVNRVIADFAEHDRGRHMAHAWHAATTAQRELLRDRP
jgi:hypothetical protein